MKESTIAKFQLTCQGLMNHFGFFLILSSSQSIALSFDKKNLVGIMSMLATVTGILIIWFNASVLMKYSPKYRIVANGVIMATGYLVVGLGWFYSFYIVMAGALIVGIGSAFGEVSHFGFLRNFPSSYVGPFWSGTGIWGLTGSLLYLVLHSVHVSDYIIFFWLVPIAFAYLSNFLFLNRLSERHNYFKNSEQDNLQFYPDSDINQSLVSVWNDCFQIYFKSFIFWLLEDILSL